MTNSEAGKRFQIIELPEDIDPEDEPLGSKRKFWVSLPSRGRCLFKEPRTGTGEDWAEKVAAELASLLQLPHASIELARSRGRRGILSQAVVEGREELIHGNEILYERVPGYPVPEPGEKRFYRLQQHRLATVLNVNSEPQLELPPRWMPPAGISRPAEVFVGYLLLDAWIGNTDRHHENWAWIRRLESTPAGTDVRVHLCASYDHGSSLGALVSDQEREQRLLTRDHQRTVEAFADRARSAFYGAPGEMRTLHPIEVLRLSALQFPEAARHWCERMTAMPPESVTMLFERIPQELCSPVSKAFAVRLLTVNRNEIVRQLGGIR